MAVLGTTFQVIIAVMLVIILFVIGFSVYNLETMKAIQDASRQKIRTDIFTGVKDLVQNGEELYTTTDDTSGSYKNLNLAVNQLGGAEYSYNFWMYVDHSTYGIGAVMPDKGSAVQPTDSGLAASDIVLFLRGNKAPYVYKNICGKDKTDILVKSPLVKLERNGNVLSVEFNTTAAPDVTHESSRNTCTDNSTNWMSMNNHKIAVSGLRDKDNLKSKWFMVSLILQDTSPSDPLPIRNKTRCAIYINGVLELERYTEGRLVGTESNDATVLLQNKGPLYVYPEIKKADGTVLTTRFTNQTPKDKSLMLADLLYFNYALSTEEITNLFNGGFKKEMAPKMTNLTASDKKDIFSDVSLSTSKKQLTSF